MGMCSSSRTSNGEWDKSWSQESSLCPYPALIFLLVTVALFLIILIACLYLRLPRKPIKKGKLLSDSEDEEDDVDGTPRRITWAQDFLKERGETGEMGERGAMLDVEKQMVPIVPVVPVVPAGVLEEYLDQGEPARQKPTHASLRMGVYYHQDKKTITIFMDRLRMGPKDYIRIHLSLMPQKKQRFRTKVEMGYGALFDSKYTFSRIKESALEELKVRFRMYSMGSKDFGIMLGEAEVSLANAQSGVVNWSYIPLIPPTAKKTRRPMF